MCCIVFYRRPALYPSALVHSVPPHLARPSTPLFGFGQLSIIPATTLTTITPCIIPSRSHAPTRGIFQTYATTLSSPSSHMAHTLAYRIGYRVTYTYTHIKTFTSASSYSRIFDHISRIAAHAPLEHPACSISLCLLPSLSLSPHLSTQSTNQICTAERGVGRTVYGPGALIISIIYGLDCIQL
jgi:hypothetical protein